MSETWQQAERRRAAEQIEATEAALTNLHAYSFTQARQQLAPAPKAVDEQVLRSKIAKDLGLTDLEAQISKFGSPPVAPSPEPVDRGSIISSFTRPALREVPLIRLSERRAVRAAEFQKAEAAIAEEERRRAQETEALQSSLDERWDEIQDVRVRVDEKVATAVEAEMHSREAAHQAEQARLDQEWAELLANDPVVTERMIHGSLAQWARAQNVSRLQSVSVAGNSIVLVATVPRPEAVVPERRADYTAAGRQTVKKRTQTDRNELFLEAVSSAVLALVKGTFAAAPGVQQTSVLMLQADGGSAEPIYWGVFNRANVLTSTYPSSAALSAHQVRLKTSGRTEKLTSIESELPSEGQAALRGTAQALS